MIKTCQHCGEKFDGHHSAKFCIDCREATKLERAREYARRGYWAHRREKLESERRRYREKIMSDPKRSKKFCARCGVRIRGHGNRKYCVECRDIVFREQTAAHRRRHYQEYREQILERKREAYIKSKLAILRGEAHA